MSWEEHLRKARAAVGTKDEPAPPTKPAWVTAGEIARGRAEAKHSAKKADKAEIPDGSRCTQGYHYLPAGSVSAPGKDGVFRVWVDTKSKSEPF